MPATKRKSAEKRQREQKLGRQSQCNENEVVQGHIHQGSEIFSVETAGRQCTCIALMSAVVAQVKDPSHWEKRDIDTILFDGDELYSKCKSEHDFLLISDLPKVVEYAGQVYNMEYHNGYCGTIGRSTTESDFYALKDAIASGLALSRLNFFVTGGMEDGYSSLIMRSEGNELYHFDSHSRNRLGLSDSNGKATLKRIDEDELVSFLNDLCSSLGLGGDSLFEIVPVTIQTPLKKYLEQQKSFQRRKEESAEVLQSKKSKRRE